MRDVKRFAFAGTDRYRVRRRLGEGGMGIVYEAEDTHHRGTSVALKTLRNLDPQALYRFKREFRALQGLEHPNLVRLGELVESHGEWFFTMELVDGVDFMTWSRTAPITPEEGTRTTAAVGAGAEARPAEIARPTGDDQVGFDESRLRVALVGTLRGIAALHEAGRIHRDIKPSNVLVCPSGRVVLLDFGLVSGEIGASRAVREPGDPRLGAADVRESIDRAVVGTPIYMAPEQSLQRAAAPPCDLYSVGVMLFEALTGQVPFRGGALEVLTAKQTQDAPAPGSIVVGLPDDLEALCAQLLRRDPDARPTVAAALAALGESPTPSPVPRSSSARSSFAGRERELASLSEAFERTRSGAAAAVLVRGPSGIGKSRLIQELLGQIRARHPETVVLEGRCYEREHIAFKAIDSLVDNLSTYWRQMPPDEAAKLLPRRAAYLPRLFPVLARVPQVAGAPQMIAVTDPDELRTRAFSAFRELLARLGDRAPLVLFLDDMQWVDGDTATLLADVLRPPNPPRLLLLLSARIGSADSSLVELTGRLGLAVNTLELAPLERREAKRLAAHLLGRRDRDVVARIATESKGSPFFISELVRYVQTEGPEMLASLTLEQLLQRRVDALSEDAKRLLGFIVIAGEPVSVQTVAMAADLEPVRASEEMRSLRAASFIRGTGTAADLVEPYHSRIREVVLRMLAPERRARYHQNLALAMLHLGGTSQQLARHFAAGGDRDEAAFYARQAADEATGTLDFDRAAQLYRLALAVGDYSGVEERQLRIAVGEALANAAYGAEAAGVFLDAAKSAPPGERLELRRRAAEQLLMAGHMERGHEAIRGVLEDISMTLPKSPRRAVLRLLRNEARLRMRGLRWSPRDESEISSAELTRIDACWSSAAGLVMSNFIMGPVFSKTGLLLALKAGEPLRVARHAGTEAVLQGMAGNQRRAQRLLALSQQAADLHGSALARFYPAFGRGLLDYNGRFDLISGLGNIDKAEQMWAEAGRGGGWEVDMCRLFACMILMFRGEMGELSQRAHGYIRAAERTGNRFLAATLGLRMCILDVVRGDWRDGKHRVIELMGSWRPGESELDQQAIFNWFSRVAIAIYGGDWDFLAKTHAETAERWRRSFWTRPPISHDDGWYHIAAYEVIRAMVQPGERADALARARAIAGRLRRSSLGLGRLYAAVVAAAIARIEGAEEAELAALERGRTIASQAGTNLHAQVIKRRIGVITGGDEGAEMVAEADEWMRSRTIADPERFASLRILEWRG